MGRAWLVFAMAGISGCYYINPQPGDPPDSTPPDAPAASPLGQVSLMEGAVALRPVAGDTWSIPDTSAVLGSGDRLWVDTVGHMEVEFGSTAIRMASETELDLTQVELKLLQLLVPQGSIDVRLRDPDTAKAFEVDAPNAAIFLEQNGEYRIDVSVNGDTMRLVAWSGHAQVAAAGRTFPVDSGQMVWVRGDSATTYEVLDAGPMDAFDRWARDRNAREDDDAGPEEEQTDANAPRHARAGTPDVVREPGAVSLRRSAMEFSHR
jgi:hypothetical protein